MAYRSCNWHDISDLEHRVPFYWKHAQFWQAAYCLPSLVFTNLGFFGLTCGLIFLPGAFGLFAILSAIIWVLYGVKGITISKHKVISRKGGYNSDFAPGPYVVMHVEQFMELSTQTKDSLRKLAGNTIDDHDLADKFGDLVQQYWETEVNTQKVDLFSEHEQIIAQRMEEIKLRKQIQKELKEQFG